MVSPNNNHIKTKKLIFKHFEHLTDKKGIVLYYLSHNINA